jgi:2-polyprenyl-6-methoxyphenol hydroxylase-like FAD-dependent oxidoreductase
MPEHRTDVDVVVVGARAAGASAAMLIARAGLSVLLVDRDRPDADTLSTHALMRGGVVQLARWKLLDQIVAAGTPPIRHTTFRYTHNDLTVSIKPSAGVDALYAPRRTLLDPVLVGAASCAGATVLHGRAVVGVQRDTHGRVVGVELRDGNGRIAPVRARLVVGADGRRSTIARLVGAAPTYSAHHTTAFIYGYWAGLDVRGYEWAYRPGAAAGFIPTNDGRTCVFAGGPPSRVGRGGVAVLRTLVEQASADMDERLRAAITPLATRTFSGQPGHLRRPWGPGWALVGDAGSWKDPISAHGLTDALRDAELLARAIITAFSDDRTEADEYRAYEITRDELTVPMLTAADEIAAFRWGDERIAELLLALNAAMNDELDVISRFADQPNRPSDGPHRASTQQPSPSGAAEEETLNLVKP